MKTPSSALRTSTARRLAVGGQLRGRRGELGDHLLVDRVQRRPVEREDGDLARRGTARADHGVRHRRAEVARDHVPLDLGRALDDLEDLRVAEPLLHGVVAHDPRAAEDLDGVGRDSHRRVGGERLRVGAEQPCVLARVERRARSPDEQSRGLDLHRHVGELERDALPAEDRLAERLPLAGVVGCVLERGAGDADRAGGHLRPRVLEEVHRDARSPRPPRPSRRSAGIRASSRTIEPVYEARRPSFRSLRPGLTPGSPRLQQEGGDPGLGAREDDRQLGDPAVRDVALLAVQHPRVPVAAGGGAHRVDVRARLRLRERDRSEAAVLRGQPRQVPRLLLLGPEPDQRPDREQRGVDRRGQARRSPTRAPRRRALP